jgi:hypothetical protein
LHGKSEHNSLPVFKNKLFLVHHIPQVGDIIFFFHALFGMQNPIYSRPFLYNDFAGKAILAFTEFPVFATGCCF